MTSLAASVGLHGLLLLLAFMVSSTESHNVGTRAPVRITYFRSTLPQPSAKVGVPIPVPKIASMPTRLPPRPVTASAASPMRTVRAPSTGTGSQQLGGDAQRSQPQPEGLGTGAEAVGSTEDTARPIGVSPKPESIVPKTEAVPQEIEAKAIAPIPPKESTKTEVPSSQGVTVAPVKAVATPTPKAAATQKPQRLPKPEAVASLPSSSGSAGNDGVVAIRKGMPQPNLVKKVVPRYPPMAKTQRVKGIVIVEVTVNERGRVVEANIKSSPSPLLNAEALSAAKKLRFAPYKIDGRTRKFSTRVPFRFDFR